MPRNPDSATDPKPSQVFSLCHSAGMCPVLVKDGDSFTVRDDHQSAPGSVRLNVEQARGLIAALQKALAANPA